MSIDRSSLPAQEDSAIRSEGASLIDSTDDQPSESVEISNGVKDGKTQVVSAEEEPADHEVSDGVNVEDGPSKAASAVSVDEAPLVHYEAPCGEFHVCSIDDAHVWLRAGYFTTETKFVFAPRDVDVTSEDLRKWTLSELVKRNGKQMPFLMVEEVDEERREEEIREVNEKSTELKNKRLDVVEAINALKNRMRDTYLELNPFHKRLNLKADYRDRLVYEKNPLYDIPTPFAELYSDDFESLRKLVLRTSVDKILEIRKNRAIPLNGINPFHILLPFKAKTTVGDETNTVTPYAIKLEELLESVDKERFETLVENQHKPLEENHRCLVCAKEVGKTPSEMIEHIISEEHVEKMLDRNLVYQEESLAFWMHTLRIAHMGAPWFPKEKDKKEDQRKISKKRDLGLRISIGKDSHPSPSRKSSRANNKPQRRGLQCRISFDDDSSSRRVVTPKRASSRPSAPYQDVVDEVVVSVAPSSESSVVVTVNMPPPPPPHITASPVQQVNPLTLVPSPFAEIAHPGNAGFVKDLVNRLSNEKILRIEKKYALPINGIEPFNVLNPAPAVLGPVDLTVMPYVNKLKELLDQCDMYRFQGVVNPRELAKGDQEQPFCILCDAAVIHGQKMPYLLLNHMTSDGHVEKMRSRFVVHSLEPLAYWMLALRIAKKDGDWFPLADTPAITPIVEAPRFSPHSPPPNFDANAPEFFPSAHPSNFAPNNLPNFSPNAPEFVPRVPPPNFAPLPPSWAHPSAGPGPGFQPGLPPPPPGPFTQEVPPSWAHPNAGPGPHAGFQPGFPPPPPFTGLCGFPGGPPPPWMAPSNGHPGFSQSVPQPWLAPNFGFPPNGPPPFFNGQCPPFPPPNGPNGFQQNPSASYQGSLVFRSN